MFDLFKEISQYNSYPLEFIERNTISYLRRDSCKSIKKTLFKKNEIKPTRSSGQIILDNNKRLDIIKSSIIYYY